jgi:hypothetical protein
MVLRMAFSDLTMGAFWMLSVPSRSRSEVNHSSNSSMSFSTCCSRSVIGNSLAISGIRLLEGPTMNNNEVIITDSAVLSSDEINRTMTHIVAYHTEGKLDEAVALAAIFLRKIRTVRTSISEQPLSRYAHKLQVLLELEDNVRRIFLGLFEDMVFIKTGFQREPYQPEA